jgi:hypothetical protein
MLTPLDQTHVILHRSPSKSELREALTRTHSMITTNTELGLLTDIRGLVMSKVCLAKYDEGLRTGRLDSCPLQIEVIQSALQARGCPDDGECGYDACYSIGPRRGEDGLADPSNPDTEQWTEDRDLGAEPGQESIM